IVLVAALNIVSGLIMLVKDKGSDIAILRTMGATQGAMMRVFLITGASIGVVGTVVGFLLGTVVCLNIEEIRRFLSWLTNTELFSPELYFLSKLPADMNMKETLAVLVMALGLSLLATLYPSWRAARLDPVEALRYEGSGAMDDPPPIRQPMTSAAKNEADPLVFLHGISRQFHQGESTLDVLKGAELAVWPGQSVALIAPSGAGKSTLLHIAGLLEHPDAGEAYI